MKKMIHLKSILFILISVFTSIQLQAQTVAESLNSAFAALAKDTCLKNANVSFCLLNKQNGKVIYQKNKDLLLAPASTLKTFTTAVALDALGENFQFKTKVIFKGELKNKIAYGSLIIIGAGDPSFGSDRFETTSPAAIFKQIALALQSKGIEKIVGDVQVHKHIFNDEPINQGWLEEDKGNYYGAGIYPLNWKENKFEIQLVPTQKSFKVSNNTAGYDNEKDFCIELVHKDGASTEEAFAYIENEKTCKFNIKGVLSNKIPSHNMQLARLNPDEDFIKDLESYLKKVNKLELATPTKHQHEIEITTILSPPLSKLVYWCNQKSLNLYAESFCKTVAVHYFKTGSWKLGIAAMSRYAATLGINPKNILLKDGCGLAPENRITTYILSSLLYHACSKKFYTSFYESLPSINGLIMKSGYIGGTRSYAGYIKLKDNTEAVFAFIIHGYTCRPKEVKLKMFQLLDKIKTTANKK